MLPIDKFDNHPFILPSAISWEWESVTALDILQIYLHSRVYKCLLLCSQDRYQEWCLVCLIFPRCFCGYIAPPLPVFFQDKLSCPSVAVNIFYYSYITLTFLIFRHNLVHAFAWVYANEHRWQLFLQDLGSFELSLISLTNSMQTLINICTAFTHFE